MGHDWSKLASVYLFASQAKHVAHPGDGSARRVPRPASCLSGLAANYLFQYGGTPLAIGMTTTIPFERRLARLAQFDKSLWAQLSINLELGKALHYFV